MKRIKIFPIIILLLLLQSAVALAQQTKTPFTVTVFRTNSDGSTGTKITANSQMLANTVYRVEVLSSTTGSLCCMRATNADGFITGSYNSGVWVTYANPTGSQSDLGSIKKMIMYIKTFSSPDFVNQLYMKVSQCTGTGGSCTNPGGAGWINPTLFLFPYI